MVHQEPPPTEPNANSPHLSQNPAIHLSLSIRKGPLVTLAMVTSTQGRGGDTSKNKTVSRNDGYLPSATVYCHPG